MEVKIEEVDGSLPQGSYISVRVGDVQKQTQYDPKKLYRFPEARRYGKVDIYQRMGTCDISWSADQPETKLCKAMGASGDTGIRLQICLTRPVGKELESMDVASPVAANPEKKRGGEKAKNYLKDHDLESLMTGAMRSLLKTMPDDPATFLCNYISKSTHGSKDLDLRSPSTAFQETEDLRRRLAAAEVKLAESENQCKELQRQIKGLKEQASMGKQVSIIDGGHFLDYYRANLLPGAKTDTFARLHASCAWPVAARKPDPSEAVGQSDAVVQPNGASWWSHPSVGTWVMPLRSLGLSKDQELEDKKSNADQKPAAGKDPQDQKLSADQELEIVHYREVVRDALVSALGDGRLVSAMQMISETTPRETQNTQPAAKQLSIFKLKHELRKSLVSSVEAGTLMQELTRIRQEDLEVPEKVGNMDELRTKMWNVMVSASADGRLEAQLANVVGAERESGPTTKAFKIHDLRIQALETMSQASKTGILSKELQTIFSGEKESCSASTSW